jgi:hypothetical protein
MIFWTHFAKLSQKYTLQLSLFSKTFSKEEEATRAATDKSYVPVSLNTG